ncbi:MAG TPA: hypothetical protein VLC98_05345 [Phnomibacter sp.]|nr:hypothetical protein [Phnomibacter sp.]
MKRIALVTLSLALIVHANAQDNSGSTKKIKPYTVSVSELIFSWGNVEAKPLEPKSIVRFSAFLHLGQQVHFDFSEHAGFYTGLSLRNVGMINELNDTVKIKQRVYTLGIPVALKFGNMAGPFLAVGAEAEFAIAYKQKVFVNEEKSKTNIWFSDRTNIFLPSAFAELKLKQGMYVKFKYYLTDFLREGKQAINVPNVGYNPTKSQMMYVSFGMAIRNKKGNPFTTPTHKDFL